MNKDKGSGSDGQPERKRGSIPSPDRDTFHRDRKDQRQQVRSDRPIPKPDKPSKGGNEG